MSKKRRTFTAEFKAKVGLEALRGVDPVHVIAQRHQVYRKRSAGDLLCENRDAG